MLGAEGRSRFRPIHLTTLLLGLGILAVAGPTWEREPPPFTEDTAPLVIALDCSATMNARDIPPSRLERGPLVDLATERVLALLSGSAGAAGSPGDGARGGAE